MKKIILSLSALAIIASLTIMTSCGGNATEENKDVQVEEVTPVAEEAPVAEASPALDLTEGKALFNAKCKVCHQENGQGIPGAFPPLAKSDYLADKTASIKATINGLQGEVTVNGVVFNSIMAPVPMSDEELLAVMNYVYNSWGNEGTITPEDIATAKQ